jgi:hypothetical protein
MCISINFVDVLGAGGVESRYKNNDSVLYLPGLLRTTIAKTQLSLPLCRLELLVLCLLRSLYAGRSGVFPLSVVLRQVMHLIRIPVLTLTGQDVLARHVSTQRARPGHLSKIIDVCARKPLSRKFMFRQWDEG